jgi:hypothetical protein
MYNDSHVFLIWYAMSEVQEKFKKWQASAENLSKRERLICLNCGHIIDRLHEVSRDTILHPEDLCLHHYYLHEVCRGACELLFGYMVFDIPSINKMNNIFRTAIREFLIEAKFFEYIETNKDKVEIKIKELNDLNPEALSEFYKQYKMFLESIPNKNLQLQEEVNQALVLEK